MQAANAIGLRQFVHGLVEARHQHAYHFNAPDAVVVRRHVDNQAEKEEPQPQVDVAPGFLMTNCAPSRPTCMQNRSIQLSYT